MKNIKRTTKKVYANEILQNRRIHKIGKVQLRRKNIQKICVSKKDSKSLKNKSAAEKRKSENEICTTAKKKPNK